MVASADEDGVDDGSSGTLLLYVRYHLQSGVYFISIFLRHHVRNDGLVLAFENALHPVRMWTLFFLASNNQWGSFMKLPAD